MKLEIGKPDYPFRHIGEIAGASLRGRKAGRDIKVLVITAEDMEKMWARHTIAKPSASDRDPEIIFPLRGIPCYVSFDRKAQRLWTFPASDGEYEMIVENAPESKSANTLHLPKKA